MKEEVKRWLEQAEADIITAEVNLNGKRYYAVILFCQQAIEKALKALWIKKINKKIPYVHDLTFLMNKLNLPSDFRNICKDLTSAYSESRYPDSTEVIPSKKFTKLDAERSLEESKRIIEWIKKNI